MKKYILLLFLILLSFSNFENSFAVYNKEARADAERDMKQESLFERSNWYKQNPKIVKETLLYSDSDEIPSYIEYKISCDKSKDCGFIIVNLDGIDARIPISGFSGETLSENLKDSPGDKYYYYSPFVRFSVSETGEVFTVSMITGDKIKSSYEYLKYMQNYLKKEKLENIKEIISKKLNISKNNLKKYGIGEKYTKKLDFLIEKYSNEDLEKLNSKIENLSKTKKIIDGKKLEFINYLILKIKLEFINNYLQEL